MPKEICYELPESIRKPLLDYLSSRPWREVNQGMSELLALKRITIPPPESMGDPMAPDADVASATGGTDG